MSGRYRTKRGPKTESLNDKQRRFVAEYLVDHNATQAAIRAGYSEASAQDMGKQNIRHPKIAAAIAAKEQAALAKVDVTVDSILRELATNVVAARAAGDFTASNRACELLGKHLSMFVDRLEHRFLRDLDKLSDAELEAIAAGRIPQ